MKTTVEIADALLREAKLEARNAGVTLRDLIEQGLRRELDARKQSARPFRLRDASYQGPSGLVAGVRYDDARALRAYAYLGTPGFPDAVEDIHDELASRASRKRSRRSE
jgi:hypothetical protein